jgi:hypothetical protein
MSVAQGRLLRLEVCIHDMSKSLNTEMCGTQKDVRTFKITMCTYQQLGRSDHTSNQSAKYISRSSGVLRHRHRNVCFRHERFKSAGCQAVWFLRTARPPDAASLHAHRFLVRNSTCCTWSRDTKISKKIRAEGPALATPLNQKLVHASRFHSSSKKGYRSKF